MKIEKTNNITLDDHKILAQKLLQIEKLYFDVQQIFTKKLSHNHKIQKAFKQDCKTCLTNKTRCYLDDEFHKIISDDEFQTLGHIYYERENIK
jgi:hypothetical protein